MPTPSPHKQGYSKGAGLTPSAPAQDLATQEEPRQHQPQRDELNFKGCYGLDLKGEQ